MTLGALEILPESLMPPFLTMKRSGPMPATIETFCLSTETTSSNHFQKVTDADSELLLCSRASLQDVLATITQIERRREKDGCFASGSPIRRRLESFLVFVERYSGAVDCLVQTTSGSFMNPATLVWGLLRILLEVDISQCLVHIPLKIILGIPTNI
jgi:hypothetical protein